MIEIYNIFKEIETESSKTKKMEILKKNSDNNTFKIFLSFMYDDTVTTGLSKKSIDNNICANEKYTEIKLNSPLNVMEFIKENNTGSNQVIFTVQSYLNKLEDDDYSEWLKYVFAKEYKCGITANTINKIFPSLIHEFKVQLAFSFEKYVDKIKGKFYITQKLDGHRTICVIDKPNDSVKFLTRKGHRIYGLNEIENDIRRTFMKTLNQDAVVVLDGEITVSKKCLPKDIFSETSKIIRKDGDKVGLQFNIFDMLLHEDFLAGKSKQEYSVRREALDSLMFIYLLNTEPLVKYIVHVPVLYQGTDKDEIAKWSDWATQQGHEGIMLNTADGFYETKRNSGLLKVKKFHSCDGIVKDMYEGTGKYVGMLGGVVVTFENQLVNIGSGFTDNERKAYWDNPELIINKICEYQYFEKTENQNGGTDLRFATWKMIREDKDENDINYE